MAERMQANPIGVWSGSYNGSYPDASAQDCAAGCTPEALARYDRQQWSSQLETFLPRDVQADILCSAGGLGNAPTREQVLMRPPYGGNCSMTITWVEREILDARQARQTFAWEFQP